MNYFVFGSNLSGRHGKGAALTAVKKWGAIYGQPFGFQGNTYGIPTKGLYECGHFPILELDVIKTWVDTFLTDANSKLETDRFFVTRIGCGLAGYHDRDIAPLFKEAPNNCEFDPLWENWGLKRWSPELIEYFK